MKKRRQHLCQRADEHLKVLDLRKSDYQTDKEKSNKLTSELVSINDKVSKGCPETARVGRKESEPLEEALDKVREAEYRLERQRKNLEEEQQALELLLEKQKGSQYKNASKTQ